MKYIPFLISGNYFQYNREKGNKRVSLHDNDFGIFTNSIEGKGIKSYILYN